MHEYKYQFLSKLFNEYFNTLFFHFDNTYAFAFFNNSFIYLVSNL